MKILIATNHSYMLYRFRRELVETLMQAHEVILSMPFVVMRRSFRPWGCAVSGRIWIGEASTFQGYEAAKTYRKMLDEIQPDLVITYSIKPNVYLGGLCKSGTFPM